MGPGPSALCLAPAHLLSARGFSSGMRRWWPRPVPSPLACCSYAAAAALRHSVGPLLLNFTAVALAGPLCWLVLSALGWTPRLQPTRSPSRLWVSRPWPRPAPRARFCPSSLRTPAGPPAVSPPDRGSRIADRICPLLGRLPPGRLPFWSLVGAARCWGLAWSRMVPRPPPSCHDPGACRVAGSRCWCCWLQPSCVPRRCGPIRVAPAGGPCTASALLPARHFSLHFSLPLLGCHCSRAVVLPRASSVLPAPVTCALCLGASAWDACF